MLARELVEQAMATFGITDYRIVSEFDARGLENKRCRHPLFDRDSIIILGDHVTLEAGTGCVHTAPGHGREDYDVGLRYGLDAYSPVDDRGRFTDEVDFVKGRFVFEANDTIVARLADSGALVASRGMTHSYPHCWRCKKPVIFRATPQWFISMDKGGLRQRCLDEIDKVTWIPHWGRERIYGMIENRPDWCVSRQRTWGVPIAVFYCEKCETLHMTPEILDHIHRMFEAHGADVWFEKGVDELLPGPAVCANCGHGQMKKETDILDVWFDSGVSHAAVLEIRPELDWPADLYLEGSDQHRGWFHSSLLTAVGNRGRAPYKSVLTHGFVVDANGKKMSKSIGNVVAPKAVINKYGAEILRLWVSASDYREDIRISDNILKQLSDAYRRIRNTSRFMIGNLFDFDPDSHAVPYDGLPEIDRFALHQLQELVARARIAYDNYEFHTIYHRLHNYCALDLSAFYLDVLKDRLYIYASDSPTRRSAQTVIHMILHAMVRLMAPILSFTAEEIWRHMPFQKGKVASVHAASLPDSDGRYMDADLAARWGQLLAVRGEVTKALEAARVAKRIGHSLDAAVTLHADDELMTVLAGHAEDLHSFFIVSQVILADHKPVDAMVSEALPSLAMGVAPAQGDKCPRCWVWARDVGSSPDHPEVCGRCARNLALMAAAGEL